MQKLTPEQQEQKLAQLRGPRPVMGSRGGAEAEEQVEVDLTAGAPGCGGAGGAGCWLEGLVRYAVPVNVATPHSGGSSLLAAVHLRSGAELRHASVLSRPAAQGLCLTRASSSPRPGAGSGPGQDGGLGAGTGPDRGRGSGALQPLLATPLPAPQVRLCPLGSKSRPARAAYPWRCLHAAFPLRHALQPGASRVLRV